MAWKLGEYSLARRLVLAGLRHGAWTKSIRPLWWLLSDFGPSVDKNSHHGSRDESRRSSHL